jgi:MFS family permease
MTFIVIADLFTPAERGRYQGLVGAVWGTASVLGPLVGGLLTDHGGGLVAGVEGWRWIFYVNVPIGAVALWLIVRRMPRMEPHGEHGPPDLASAFLLLGGLVPLILALQLDKRRFPWLPGFGVATVSTPWHAWVTPALATLAVAALVGFVARSRRVADPIIDLRLFENRLFRRANAAGFFFGAAFLSVVVFLPLFLVNVSGLSATSAGIALTPFSLGLVLGSTVSGQLVARFGRLRDVILVAGILLIAALALLATMDGDVGYVTVMAYMLLCGLGLGPSLPLFTLAIQNAVPVRQVGQATSAAQFFRQIGGTVGVALMGTVLVTTLGTAFASLELPVVVAAEPAFPGATGLYRGRRPAGSHPRRIRRGGGRRGGGSGRS